MILIGPYDSPFVGRAVSIGTAGADAVYNGLAAQIYYACASLAAVLLGPNLLWMVFLRLNQQLAGQALYAAKAAGRNRLRARPAATVCANPTHQWR